MSRLSEGALTIGELSRATGVAVATLRAWESRYGFPGPVRTESGHRRYRQADARLVADVLASRDAGRSLSQAIGHALGRTQPESPAGSLFAPLRQMYPELPLQRLSRRAMLALSTAIEDESCARGQRPVLIGAFQEERFFRARETRWAQLARGANLAMALATFPTSTISADSVVEIALPPTAAMHREWALICGGPRTAACLVGWEIPGANGKSERYFEAVWTVRPEIVVAAARLVLAQAAALAPALVAPLNLDALIAELPADTQLVDATAMMLRALNELDAAR